MKELTAAQGLLRCGECDTIFDAMKALSTTLPEERKFIDSQVAAETSAASKPVDTKIRVLPPNHKPSGARGKNHHSVHKAKNKPAARSRKFLLLSLAALAVLLLLQLLYTSRGWLMEHPATSKVAQRVCAAIGCEMNTLRDVQKIRVLSRNVYSHPNLPEQLIISSSIQNDASFDQPYPLLEISFLSNTSEIVALRRFTPEEYMGDDRSNTLMQSGIAEEFSVHITDPGQEAVNFRLRFL